MGGALAALGILTGCGWDEDTAFSPQYLGSYLRIDSSLWWVSADTTLVQLPYSVRSITSSPWGMMALALHGQTLYLFQGKQLHPSQTINLNETCSQVRSFWEKDRLCLACASGLRIARSQSKSTFVPQWETIAHAGGYTHVAVGSAFILAASQTQVCAYEPQRFAQVASIQLPGPIYSLWIEHPTGAAGSWKENGSLVGNFSYTHSARLFYLDTAGRTLLRQTSPYLKKSFGTEYLGSVSLAVDSTLSVGGYRPVSSFAVDFFRGEILFLRSDSLWRVSISQVSVPTLIGAFPQAKEVEVVPVYRYGSAEVTMR